MGSDSAWLSSLPGVDRTSLPGRVLQDIMGSQRKIAKLLHGLRVTS